MGRSAGRPRKFSEKDRGLKRSPGVVNGQEVVVVRLQRRVLERAARYRSEK
jgi:hypothetical protein